MTICGTEIDFTEEKGYFFSADCMEGTQRWRSYGYLIFWREVIN